MDTGLLIRQYRNRNVPGCQLDAEQRRRWAAETTEVLERLGRELLHLIGEAPNRVETTREWNAQMAAGRRFVTGKEQRLTGAPPHSGYPANWPQGEQDRWNEINNRARAVMGYMEGAQWVHDRQGPMGWLSPGDLARESEDGLKRALVELERIAPTITPGKMERPRRPGKRD